MISQSFFKLCSDRVDNTLKVWLDSRNACSEQLMEAMRYSVFNGGKRIRPALVYAVTKCIKGEHRYSSISDAAAASVECIHAYSLVHDDLPAMDDDVLRRGKPTCHIAFDEATAILAGDALQTLAFQQLSALADEDAPLVLRLIHLLSEASGHCGMVSGQMLDIKSERQSNVSLDLLEKIHRYKTGALIKASVLMGAHIAGANPHQLDCLSNFAECIGLAYQVKDDIIDVTSDTATLGKSQGADIALEKSTYVSLLGLNGAEEKLVELQREAKKQIDLFGKKAILLENITDFIVSRNA